MRKLRLPCLGIRILLTVHFCLYAVTPLASSFGPALPIKITQSAPVLKLFAVEALLKKVSQKAGTPDSDGDNPRILMRKRHTAVRPIEDIHPPQSAHAGLPQSSDVIAPGIKHRAQLYSAPAIESSGHSPMASGLSPPAFLS